MTDSATFGFVLALISAFPFAAYILPRKLSTLPVLEYQFWLSIAIVPSFLFIAWLFQAPLTGRRDLLFWAFSCGLLWAMGSIFYSLAVDHLGVARSTPIKNLAPMFASTYGIVIFGEYTIREPRGLLMDILGVSFMVLAAVILGRAGALEHERAFAYDASRTAMERKKAFIWGWVFSFLTAVMYGSYSIPLKHVLRQGFSPYSACAHLGLGVLTFSIMLYATSKIMGGQLDFVYPNRRELGLTTCAGVIWASGQLLGTVAMLHVPMSVSWPVSNLSTLIAIVWGVWVFREVHLEKHKGEVAASVGFYILGLVLLALAAPRGKV